MKHYFIEYWDKTPFFLYTWEKGTRFSLNLITGNSFNKFRFSLKRMRAWVDVKEITKKEYSQFYLEWKLRRS